MATLSLADIAVNLEAPGVPFPPVPKALSEYLMPLSDYAFGSCLTEIPLYHLEAHLEQLLKQWPSDYVMYGLSGHGFNSRAVHYYLVTDRCALFVQRSMPVLSSSALQPGQLTHLMQQTIELSCHPALDSCEDQLVVVDSDILYGRIGKFQNGQLNWQHEADSAIEHALAIL
ncbi:hypothetical protein [Salinisphaera sp. G21_0]|uniref:hypothetical protein n=1 Tax=Salinisphaera sp. G21_0 TaxID=2821094 RepID=UPI001ADC6510|nr:hypothetical protein [Salinisphaera sp. G21_0]MBO9479923.1 hypothetical protein [Salinisphaera sp. G21_0]